MYQVLVFILLLLAQAAHGKTDPLANEEPLYTGGSTTSSTSSTTRSVTSTEYDSSNVAATTTASSTTASTDCKMDENVLLCLCKSKFSGQMELCMTAAGNDNVLLAYQATLQASRAANPSAGRAAAPTTGIDPALLSLFSGQQQSGGMDMMQMMQLMQMLFPQDNQSQGMTFQDPSQMQGGEFAGGGEYAGTGQ